MSRVIFNATSGGTVTLDAQDTVDTKVLTIPAANGTLLYDNGSGTQTFNNVVVTGNAAIATGQVVATPSASTDITNKAYVDSSIVSARYTAGTGLTLAAQQFSITNTGATAATYGSASGVPVFALNAQGQLTSAVSTAIAIAATQITSGTLNSARLTGGYPNVIAGSSTNVVGGLSGSIPYQTAINTTAMLAKGTNGQVLSLAAGLPAWIDVAGVGTVTSVDGSGGTTGLTLTGGPITASGTLTLGGTLAVANGGTGATTAAAALTSLGAYPASNPSGYTNNNGTVTSVAAITLGTTGTDLSSTVATGTTTPVITLQVPTASAANRGALSAADWSTFNSKGSGTVTAVSVASSNGFTGTSSGGATPALTLATSITGVLKGNGTALSAGTAGTDYVAPATATNFTAQQYFGNVALTDAATIAWATNTAQVATFTFVSTNRTVGSPTGLVSGGFYALAVIQNAGANTLTWNSVFKWAAGTAPTLSTAAAAKDYFVFRSDGTNLYEQGRSLGVA